ncbi:hypothetical protein BASA81_008455 [Batrachochytrium salamandrivorans]|nr:hypothetical protein BASA81_008455 [Batrachochytrium salamandrivorans]
MACNFWASSHCKRWLFSKAHIQQIRAQQHERASQDLENLHRQLIFAIQQVGKALRFDQIVAATGTLFFKRLLIKDPAALLDARVAAIGSLYLAAKVEEMGPISVMDVVERFKSVSKTHNIPIKSDVTLGEVYAMERAIVRNLDFDLVVFHPYSDLERFSLDLSDFTGLQAQQLDHVIQLAWTVLNDSQRCDCALVFPPIIICLAAIYLAATVLGVGKVEDWFDTLNVQSQQVRECAEDILQSSSDDKRIRM